MLTTYINKHLHIRTHTCIYIYVYIYTYICIFTYICTHTPIHTQTVTKRKHADDISEHDYYADILWLKELWDNETLGIPRRVKQHDAYCCEKFPGSKPLPTVRPLNFQHVGEYLYAIYHILYIIYYILYIIYYNYILYIV